jgi:hypothetical protein
MSHLTGRHRVWTAGTARRDPDAGSHAAVPGCSRTPTEAVASGAVGASDWASCLPRTRYAKSGDVHLAYQAVGEGALDLVLVHGWVSNVEYGWEVPPLGRFLDRLAAFSRLILFDRRGTGMSDRLPDVSCRRWSSAWTTSEPCVLVLDLTVLPAGEGVSFVSWGAVRREERGGGRGHPGGARDPDRASGRALRVRATATGWTASLAHRVSCPACETVIPLPEDVWAGGHARALQTAISVDVGLRRVRGGAGRGHLNMIPSPSRRATATTLHRPPSCRASTPLTSWLFA